MFCKTTYLMSLLFLFQKLLDENASQRHKIAVHVVSIADGGAGTKLKEESLTNEVKVIEDVTVFKSSHGMHPLVQPYINITRKGNKCKL